MKEGPLRIRPKHLPSSTFGGMPLGGNFGQPCRNHLPALLFKSCHPTVLSTSTQLSGHNRYINMQQHPIGATKNGGIPNQEREFLANPAKITIQPSSLPSLEQRTENISTTTARHHRQHKLRLMPEARTIGVCKLYNQRHQPAI